MTIDHHGSRIKHSIYGRKLGLDHNDFLTGFLDVVPATETVTAASTLSKGGTSLLAATAVTVWELPPPVTTLIGARKRLINNTTGLSQLVKLTAGNFQVNSGTTYTTLTLSGKGVAVDLEYISTALVEVVTPFSTLTTGFASYFQPTTTT